MQGKSNSGAPLIRSDGDGKTAKGSSWKKSRGKSSSIKHKAKAQKRRIKRFPVKEKTEATTIISQRQTPNRTMRLIPHLFALAGCFFIAPANADDDGLMDRLPNCEELVQKNECQNSPKKMMQDCPLACRKWQESRTKVEYAYIDEDQPSFFRLKAKNSTGSELGFEMFDGYLTIVANVLKDCMPGQIDLILNAMEHLHDVWPYSLEILVFPFSTPERDDEVIAFQTSIGCDPYFNAINKKGRRIHVMEEAKLNGDDAHPVYQYLSKQFEGRLGVGGMPTDLATFFIVTPDGDRIEAHIGISPGLLKHTIALHMERDL